jgi:hypothetical protein
MKLFVFYKRGNLTLKTAFLDIVTVANLLQIITNSAEHSLNLGAISEIYIYRI